MRASVVVPTKDRGGDIVLTLDALLRQTVEDFEIVVVDNASCPADAERLQDWVDQHGDRARYVSEPEIGLNVARNRGIDTARGSVIAFLDDDAVPVPTWLESYLETFAGRADAWALGGPIRPAFDSPPPAWLDNRMMLMLGDFDHGPRVTELHHDEYPRGANVAFRREVFERLGRFRRCLDRRGNLLLSYGDIEMSFRIERAGHKVLYVPGAEVQHLIRPDRLSPAWFAHRSYWQGRSEALFERIHYGFARQLSHLPYRLVRSFISRGPNRRSQHRGLLVGTLRHLLQRDFS